MKRSITILTMLLLIPVFLFAQTTYKIAPNSKIQVDGTSTLHDWTMLSTSLQGDATLDVKAGKLVDIRGLKFSLAAESLKSGKSGLDKNAYEALMTNKYPQIKFEMTTLNQVEQKGNEGTLLISGVLTMAGFSKQEKIEVRYTIDKEGVLHCKGKKEIKMSNYAITPPSFMMGSMSTGDAVTITFDINLSNKAQVLQ